MIVLVTLPIVVTKWLTEATWGKRDLFGWAHSLKAHGLSWWGTHGGVHGNSGVCLRFLTPVHENQQRGMPMPTWLSLFLPFIQSGCPVYGLMPLIFKVGLFLSPFGKHLTNTYTSISPREFQIHLSWQWRWTSPWCKSKGKDWEQDLLVVCVYRVYHLRDEFTRCWWELGGSSLCAETILYFFTVLSCLPHFLLSPHLHGPQLLL